MIVDEWLGFVLYRIVFARSVPDDDDLRAIVDALPINDV